MPTTNLSLIVSIITSISLVGCATEAPEPEVEAEDSEYSAAIRREVAGTSCTIDDGDKTIGRVVFSAALHCAGASLVTMVFTAGVGTPIVALACLAGASKSLIGDLIDVGSTLECSNGKTYGLKAIR